MFGLAAARLAKTGERMTVGRKVLGPILGDL